MYGSNGTISSLLLGFIVATFSFLSSGIRSITRVPGVAVIDHDNRTNPVWLFIMDSIYITCGSMSPFMLLLTTSIHDSVMALIKTAKYPIIPNNLINHTPTKTMLTISLLST